MKVTVQGGRAIQIEGDPTHPFTRGFLCGKVGRHYLDLVYSPRRVLSPHRRVGARGAGRFEHITWDQAIADIVGHFRAIIAAHGPEAILQYSYSGTLGMLNEGTMDQRFFNRLGASRLDRTICSAAGKVGYGYTVGASIGTDPEAFALARLIIVWGSNPATSGVHLMPFIKEARHHGARLVVIDPRLTRTARLADWYIPIQPGTDAALALGIMHVLIRDDLLDHDFIQRSTVGFEPLKARVQAYPPERVSAITGVPVTDIEQLARDYATIRPAAIRINYGIQRHTNGGMMVRTIACLPALIGAWRQAGGGILLSTSGAFPLNTAALRRRDLWPDGEPRLINMNRLGEALLTLDDPPIKALFVYDSNPASSAPDSARVIEGLKRDDLFTVVHDQFWTDTTDYADLVLPATTQLEHYDLHVAYGNYTIQINQPAIAPPGESVSNFNLFKRLAKAMGFSEACFDDTEFDCIDQALAVDHPHLSGITRERLLRDGWARLNLPPGDPPGSPRVWAPFADGLFPTPSGKVELYSEAMARDGYDPLPAHVPLTESPQGLPELAEKYPIQLVSPSAHFILNTSFGHIEPLLKKQGQPFIELNARDATARGIADGDLCRVFNDRGECFLYARVRQTVKPGVAAAESIWWAKLAPGGKGINQLTSDRLTDMGRGATFYTNLVQVSKT
jgi:anaerobic selenocysteine-containing dehydrogenase